MAIHIHSRNTTSEVAIILKTRASLFEPLASLVHDGHPSTCPCIVGWPLTAVAPTFLAWLNEETRPPLS